MTTGQLEILHVADIHGRPELDVSRAAQGIAEAVTAAGSKPNYFVASGDIGYQGQYHEIGARFVRELATRLDISTPNIICCPGNHDIQLNRLDRPFDNYKRALLDIYNDATRVSAEPVLKYVTDPVEFLVINSAYHLDHQYGKVDTRELARCATARPFGRPRVAVIHHHLIPVIECDHSCVVNAYECLKVLVDNEFDLVLHGHHHMALSLTVGKRVKLVGVGSVNYPPRPHINNQFNIVTIGQRLLRFRYIADATTQPGLLAWEPKEEAW